MKNYINIFKRSLIFILLLTLNSCSNNDDILELVVSDISIDGDRFSYTFSTFSQYAKSYEWDFGDGIGTSTEAIPTYEYSEFGTYTVTLTVTGEEGSIPVTKTIDFEVIPFAYSLEEIKVLLSGGSSKTWVIGSVDGTAPISNDMTITMPFTGDVLGDSGLGDEKNDEYTFGIDGSYSIDRKNGLSLAALQEPEFFRDNLPPFFPAYLITPSTNPDFYFGQVDLETLAFFGRPIVLSGTFSLSTDDLSIPDTQTGGGTPIDFFDPISFPGNPVTKQASLVVEGPNPLSPSEMAPSFFGIYGARFHIIKFISETKLVVALSYDTNDDDGGFTGTYDLDSFITITFVPIS